MRKPRPEELRGSGGRELTAEQHLEAAQKVGDEANAAQFETGEKMQAGMENFSPGLTTQRQMGPKEYSHTERELRPKRANR